MVSKDILFDICILCAIKENHSELELIRTSSVTFRLSQVKIKSLFTYWKHPVGDRPLEM